VVKSLGEVVVVHLFVHCRGGNELRWLLHVLMLYLWSFLHVEGCLFAIFLFGDFVSLTGLLFLPLGRLGDVG